MAFNFQGKRAIVTGAGSGIGRDIAKTLSASGAQVYGITLMQTELDSLKEEYPAIETVCVDVSDWKACQAAITAISPVDLLVNCAGIYRINSFLDTTEEEFDAQFNVNVKGYLAVGQVVAQQMVQHKIKGSIVNISSINSQRALSSITYCAGKGAVDQLTRCMAVELGPNNIRVNAVQPGLVPATQLAQNAISLFPAERLKTLMDRTPMARLPDVENITSAVLYLLSDKSDMITGAVIPVDGGFLCT